MGGGRSRRDLVAESDDVFATLVAALTDAETTAAEDAARPVVVHLEERFARPFSDARRAQLSAAGFVPQAQPQPSVPSTIATEASGVRVWTRWLTDAPRRTLPYYGQTTDVTCGAVTALGALHANGQGDFTGDRDENHSLELAFWRRATNLPACEPVGLAVAARESTGPDAPGPRVILSTDRPVLLEEYRQTPHELRLREDLQAEARRRAGQLGVPVEQRWVEIDEIADLVRSGNLVGILIDLMPLINDPSPHWILAYGVVDGNIVVSDPWIESEHAESWADAYALPLRPAMLDRIARWGEPVYRGIVVFPPAE